MAVKTKPLTEEERRLMYEEREIEEEAAEERIEIDSSKLPSTYSQTLQGKGINGLIASSTSGGGIQLNAVTHAGTMESEGVLITIEEQAIQDISPQTFKVLVILITKATSQLPRADAITPEAIVKGRTVTIPLDEYMRLCNIKDRKEARIQLNNAINALYAISLEWEEVRYSRPEGKTRKVKESIPYRLRIIDKTAGNPVRNNVAEITFSYDMAAYLSASYMMPYPSALLTVNTRYHPYSIPLGWKLCTHNNMNYGKPNYGRISVKTLLSAAKGIPRYETLADKGEIYRRIISRLDRDLYALVEAEVLDSYSYLDADGAPVDRSLLSGYTYAQFSLFTVLFELKDYPEARHAERLELKQKRISAAISRNRKKAEEKEARTESTTYTEKAEGTP